MGNSRNEMFKKKKIHREREWLIRETIGGDDGAKKKGQIAREAWERDAALIPSLLTPGTHDWVAFPSSPKSPPSPHPDTILLYYWFWQDSQLLNTVSSSIPQRHLERLIKWGVGRRRNWSNTMDCLDTSCLHASVCTERRCETCAFVRGAITSLSLLCTTAKDWYPLIHRLIFLTFPFLLESYFLAS